MIPPNESLIHSEFILELREKEAREKNRRQFIRFEGKLFEQDSEGNYNGKIDMFDLVKFQHCQIVKIIINTVLKHNIK